MEITIKILLGLALAVYLLLAFFILREAMKRNRETLAEKRKNWPHLQWMSDCLLLFLMNPLAVVLSLFWIVSVPVIRIAMMQ